MCVSNVTPNHKTDQQAPEWCSPLQAALTPLQVPLSRQTRVVEPISWKPWEHTKWTSCPTKNLEPNLVPWAGASREGQVVGAVGEKESMREMLVTCGVSLPTSSGILCLGIYTCHLAAARFHGKKDAWKAPHVDPGSVSTYHKSTSSQMSVGGTLCTVKHSHNA